MSEDTPNPQSRPAPLNDEDALANRVFNDRLKLVTNAVQAIALTVFGAGVLRFLLDPPAPSVGIGRLVLTFGAALAIEAVGLYLLGKQRREK